MEIGDLIVVCPELAETNELWQLRDMQKSIFCKVKLLELCEPMKTVFWKVRKIIEKVAYKIVT